MDLFLHEASERIGSDDVLVKIDNADGLERVFAHSEARFGAVWRGACGV